VRDGFEIVAVAGRPVRFAVSTRLRAGPRENVIEVLRISHSYERARSRPGKKSRPITTAFARWSSPVFLLRSLSHHHRPALALEASGQVDPEWLAMHWQDAENLERAAEFAALAARQA
jgi:hypothetical protein